MTLYVCPYNSPIPSSLTLGCIGTAQYMLVGMGQSLVIATDFEFISAQSPFSMKGLLIHDWSLLQYQGFLPAG